MAVIGTVPIFDHKTSDITNFVERISQYFIANSITEETRKRAILLNALTEETYALTKDILFPDKPENKSLDELTQALKKHLCPIKSFFAERLKFFEAKKKQSETVAEWAARVKSLAAACKFGSELEMVIRDIFVVGINDRVMMDRLFEEDASNASTTFLKMVKLAQAKESSIREQEMYQKEIKEEPADAMYHQQTRRKSNFSSGENVPTGRGSSWGQRDSPVAGNQESSSKNRKCFCCGKVNHTVGECRYRECKCYKCGVKGHLAPMCKKNRQSRRILSLIWKMKSHRI